MRIITFAFPLTVAGTQAKRVQVTKNIFLAMFNFNLFGTIFLEPVTKPRGHFFTAFVTNSMTGHNFRAATQPRGSWDSTFSPMQLFLQSLTAKQTVWPKTKNLSGRPLNFCFLFKYLNYQFVPYFFLSIFA